MLLSSKPRQLNGNRTVRKHVISVRYSTTMALWCVSGRLAKLSALVAGRTRATATRTTQVSGGAPTEAVLRTPTVTVQVEAALPTEARGVEKQEGQAQDTAHLR